MWGEAGGRTDAVAAGPSPAGEVRVLQTPLEPALFALVDFVPEAEGSFGDVPGVTRASATTARCSCCTWGNFQSAAGVVGIGRAVAADPVGSNGRGGQRRVAGLYGSSHGAGLLAYVAATWNCRGIDDLDAGVTGVARASSIFSTVVRVEVPLRSGMVLDPAEVGEALDGSEGAIRASSRVGKLRGAVAPDAVAGEDFKPNVKFLLNELEFGAGAKSASKARIIVGADGAVEPLIGQASTLGVAGVGKFLAVVPTTEQG